MCPRSHRLMIASTRLRVSHGGRGDPAGEKHVVFGLEPLQLRLERLQVALDFGLLGHISSSFQFPVAAFPGPRLDWKLVSWKPEADIHLIRNHNNGSHSSRAYGTGRSSMSTSRGVEAADDLEQTRAA